MVNSSCSYLLFFLYTVYSRHLANYNRLLEVNEIDAYNLFLSPFLQLEALKQQNSNYQEELNMCKEQLSSENQRTGSLCKEMCVVFI